MHLARVTGEDHTLPSFLGSSATFIPRPKSHSSSDTSSAGGGDQWDIYTADADDDLGVLLPSYGEEQGVYTPSLAAVTEEAAAGGVRRPPAGAAGAGAGASTRPLLSSTWSIFCH